VRGIDQALVDEVWRETTSYPPGRIDDEARDFLTRQPHVAAFACGVTREQDAAVQRAALGLCFLLFKILERSLGRPVPLLAQARIDEAQRAARERREPDHPTLPAYILAMFYGPGAEETDERVRAGLALMLRTLTDALEVGRVEI
jgi:hypothetical protein